LSARICAERLRDIARYRASAARVSETRTSLKAAVVSDGMHSSRRVRSNGPRIIETRDLFAVTVGMRGSFQHEAMANGKRQFLLIYQFHVPSLMKPFTVE